MSIHAYELVPVIESLGESPVPPLHGHTKTKQSKSQLECLESSGNHIYIGTSDGCVFDFSFVEKKREGQIFYECRKERQKLFAQRRPIDLLKTASALDRILVLTDATVSMLSMIDLEGVPSAGRIKGVAWLCLNENPDANNPFSVQICVAMKKKTLQLYVATEDKIIHERDIILPDFPISLAMDGANICVALSDQYIVVNYETNVMQDLFRYEAESTLPLIRRIGQEEFLLSGPSSLGMFANAEGISRRPPIQMIDSLRDACFYHPYVLAMNNEFITVHSCLDQQQKQTMPFTGGKVLGNYDGRVFVASSRQVYSAVPVSFEKQIQALLDDKRVTEALELARNSYKTGLSQENFDKMIQRLQQQAGFIEFAQLHFEQAKENFVAGCVDVREVISLYPLLLPESSNFMRSVPPLHDIADIRQVTRGNQEQMKQCKLFLVEFLHEIRKTSQCSHCREDVDTALVKLCSELDSDGLSELVISDCRADVRSCLESMQRYHRYHAIALLYRMRGDYRKALDLWKRLVEGELVEDGRKPELRFISETLSDLHDVDLIWSHMDWLARKDADAALKVFISHTAIDGKITTLQPESVIEFLQHYPESLIKYMEYLVFTQLSKKEKLHTQLALYYVDRVRQLTNSNAINENLINQSRADLQYMLRWSSLYRVEILLGKVKDMQLYTECSILYGKLGEHEKALDILVHQLGDYKAAEDYCISNASGKDRSSRQHLFASLLHVYLNTSQTNTDRSELLEASVRLLNSHLADFDAVQVIRMIPSHWPIAKVEQFLMRSVRKTQSLARTKVIEQALARAYSIRTQVQAASIKNNQEIITEDRLCGVCHRPFSEEDFLRFPMVFCVIRGV